MASIESSIYLVDQVSPTLFGIADAVQDVTTAMDIASNTMDHAFSPHSIEEVGESMVELQQKLQNINHMQEAINTVANNIYVLPKDTGEELKVVNREIRRINTALEFIQNNPFDLDSSFAISQIESLTSSMDTAIQRQSELNQQLGNMPERMITLQVEPDIPEPLIAPQEPVTVPIEPDIPEPLVDPQEPVTVPIEPDIPEPLIDPPEPVKIPVQWETDNLEVFTGTGIERFQQEIQSANDMLHLLNETQNHISNTAMQMDIFPENAIVDISNMQSRIQEIQGHIQMLASNPLNLGVDEVNIELEQLRARLSQAIQEQQQLNRAVQSMDVRSANEAYLRLSRTVGYTERYIRDNTKQQQKFNHEIQEGTSCADHLANRIMGMVAAYGGLQGIRSLANLSDEYTQTQARLNLMVDSQQQLLELQDHIFAIAQRSRVEYNSMADSVSKLALNAGHAFKNQEQILLFSENMSKAFKISGASIQEQNASMLQLTQALASGTLRGDELNSVLEQAPMVARSIEQYMGWAEGSIKDYASEGLVNSQIVVNSILSMTDQINKQFDNIPKTWGDTWIHLKNVGEYALRGLYQEMTRFLNTEDGERVIQGLENAIVGLADTAIKAFKILEWTANMLVEHWEIAEPILIGIVTTLGTYMTINAIKSAVAWAMTNWELLLIIGSIAAIIYILHKLGVTNEEIVGGICGGLNVVKEFFYNVALGAKLCGAAMAAYFGAVAHNIPILFKNTILNIKAWFWDLLADMGQGIVDFVEKINRIPGVHIDVSGLSDGVMRAESLANNARMDKEVYLDADAEATKVTDKMIAEYGYPFDDGWQQKAFDDGYKWGSNLVNGIGNTLQEIDDIMNRYPLEQDKRLAGVNNIPGIDDMNSSLNRIDKNTRDTARSVGLSSTDIKYLLNMANRKSRDRYTTPINLHITNNNKVNSELDIDGVVNKMSKATLKRINEEWKASIVR